MKKTDSRRSFIKKAGVTAAALAVGTQAIANKNVHILGSKIKLNGATEVRIGLIGSGIIGHYDTDTALKVAGVRLVAVCDLYTGRLERAKEKWGKDVFTTRDYREILAKSDIDAVLICTSDNWHKQIAVDALKAGKHVYCEKPMVQFIEQGQEIIDAQKASGKVFQVGSQRASSAAILKAKEYYKSGIIGELTNVQAANERWNSGGAWNYSIPTDASPETVDFDTFLGDAPKVPFDPVRFFRWRNFKEYGTGVAGDLFVHLLTGVHVITGAIGPRKIYALGDLNYWKDGRTANDLVTGILDYPATKEHASFQFITQVNLANGSKKGNSATRLIGTEGVINIGWNDFTIETLKRPVAPGYGGYDAFESFSAKQQAAYKKWYEATYGDSKTVVRDAEPITFKSENGYDDRYDHMVVFFNAVRANRPQDIVEDATFGLRTAAPSIACNISAEKEAPILWDPLNMKVLG